MVNLNHHYLPTTIIKSVIPDDGVTLTHAPPVNHHGNIHHQPSHSQPTFSIEKATDEHSFVDLGSVWHAPLFEIALAPHKDYRQTEGFVSDQNCEKRNIPAFGSLVANETNSDMEADFLNRIYIIPKQSSFYMSIESSLHDTSGPVRSLSEFGCMMEHSPVICLSFSEDQMLIGGS